jgi:hypothetical protein
MFSLQVVWGGSLQPEGDSHPAAPPLCIQIVGGIRTN